MPPKSWGLSTETTDLGGGFVKTLNRFYDGYGRPRSLAVGTDYTTAYGYDATSGRLSQVWERPYLSAIGDPLGEESEDDPPTRPVLEVGDFNYGYLPDSGLVHKITKAASGTNPALVATRTWESTRDVLQKIENRILDGEVRSSYTYTVNETGQRTAVATTGSEFAGSPANWSWGYDSLGQLAKADAVAADIDRSYQYDTTGNRITSATGNYVTATNFDASSTASYYGVLTDGTPSAPGANTLNQYAAIRGQFTADPAYDFDGNMTAGPVPGSNGNTPGVQAPANATNIGWDAENRLISATVNSITYNYEYDHLSRLVVRKVGTAISRRYIHDGWNRIAEYESSATTPYNTYTWGLDLSGSMQGAGGVGGLLAASEHSGTVQNPVRTPYYPTYDGNGNISEYLDFSGAAAVHYEYDPFGTVTRLTGSNSTRFQFRFSTKPRDPDTGLYYYGYRWYDPLTGRWPSRDPIEERGGVNLYEFVSSCPIDYVDRLGRELTEYKEGSAKAYIVEDKDFFIWGFNNLLAPAYWTKEWPEEIAKCDGCKLKLDGRLFGRIVIRKEYIGRTKLPEDAFPSEIKALATRDSQHYESAEVHEREHERIDASRWNAIVRDFNPWDGHVFKHENCCLVWKRYIKAVLAYEIAAAGVEHADWDFKEYNKDDRKVATEKLNAANAWLDKLGAPLADANCKTE